MPEQSLVVKSALLRLQLLFVFFSACLLFFRVHLFVRCPRSPHLKGEGTRIRDIILRRIEEPDFFTPSNRTNWAMVMSTCGPAASQYLESSNGASMILIFAAFACGVFLMSRITTCGINRFRSRHCLRTPRMMSSCPRSFSNAQAEGRCTSIALTTCSMISDDFQRPKSTASRTIASVFLPLSSSITIWLREILMALKSAVLEVELAVSRAMYTGVPGKHV